ncbi:MATE family efflux transporter [Segnochrobactraceae bacterium EtOH-i3]
MSRSGPASARAAWFADARATLFLALPLAATQLLEISLNTTDVIMVGWLGPEALAAVALGSVIQMLALMLCIGVAIAVSSLVSQARGGRTRHLTETRLAVRHGLWAVTVVGVPVAALLWNIAPVLFWLGQDPALIPTVQGYVRAAVLGAVPAGWFTVMRSFLAAMERPRPGLVAMALAFVLNIGLNWLLIFGNLGFPALGAVGAGIASTVCNLASFLFLVGFVLVDRRARRSHVLGHVWRIDVRRLWHVLRLGAPIGLTLVLELGLFTSAALLVGRIGADALAAHQIALQVGSVTFMVTIGISQATTVRVGYAYGAADRDGVRRAGQVGFALAVVFMSCTALTMAFFNTTIVSFFLDEADPAVADVARLAAQLLLFAAMFQIVDGLQVVGQGILRGLNDTRMALGIASVGYWLIGLPVSALLSGPYGVQGVWMGFVIGISVVGVLCVARFLALTRERTEPRLAAG